MSDWERTWLGPGCSSVGRLFTLNIVLSTAEDNKPGTMVNAYVPAALRRWRQENQMLKTISGFTDLRPAWVAWDLIGEKKGYSLRLLSGYVAGVYVAVKNALWTHMSTDTPATHIHNSLKGRQETSCYDMSNTLDIGRGRIELLLTWKWLPWRLILIVCKDVMQTS